MVVRKRKKILKKRGQRSPGYGSQKKHRGGGSRGGRGKAGLHKHKRMTALKYMPDHFGKTGFRRPDAVTKSTRTINLKELDSKIDKLLEQRKITKEKSGIKVSLFELGYDKLLGSGRLNHKLIVKGKFFSKNAIRKLEEAGGKAIVEKNV